MRTHSFTKMLLICAIVALSCAPAILQAQSPRTVRVHVDGMPAGLAVSLLGQTTRCATPTSIVQFIAAGSVLLTEQTFTTIESVTLPGGLIVLRPVAHTSYSGEMTVLIPANNGCTAIPRESFRYFYSVLGDQDGSMQIRNSAPFGAVLAVGINQFSNTMEAETTSITRGNGSPITSMARGVFNSVTVFYNDEFGGEDIVTPTLELTQPGTILGTSVSRMKISVTDLQVCLRVAGATQCRARSLGGTLANGGVTVSVSSIQFPQGLTRTRFIELSLRLDDAFPAGDFTLVANADDLDPFDYVVDGDPQPINLLPFKSLKIPVTVIN